MVAGHCAGEVLRPPVFFDNSGGGSNNLQSSWFAGTMASHRKGKEIVVPEFTYRTHRSLAKDDPRERRAQN